MSTNVGKKNIANKKSGHGSVGPGAISLVSPPAPPAPAPFLYTARTANTTKVPNSSFLYQGNPFLTVGSVMDVDPPANAPSKPTGGDLVTHADTKIAVTATGSYSLTADGEPVCGTGDLVNMNVLTAQMKVAQMQVPLLEAADFDTASKSHSDAAKVNKKVLRAYPPGQAKQTKAGDPVDLGTGFVVDDAIDLDLPGYIPLVWRRSYSSAASTKRTALGVGGWAHSFEQWLEPSPTALRLWNEEGAPVDIAIPADGEASFHRGERLELRRVGRGYEVWSLDDRQTRVFSPLPDGRLALHAIHDPHGHQIRLSYDGNALVRLIDSVGREIRVSNNRKGRVIRVEVWAAAPGETQLPSLQTWFEYSYHPGGELLSHTNVLGDVARWDYDGLHRLIKASARNGISFCYEYLEGTGRCVRTWGDNGLHDVRIEVDPKSGEARTHGTSRARRYLMTNGIVCREETFEGTWARTREYDDDELLISVGNAADERTTYEYDERGNLVKETDPAGNISTWICVNDRPVQVVAPSGLETRFQYDNRGDLVGISLPGGASHQFELDAHGRLLAIRGKGGAPWLIAYDEHGNIACVATAGGARTIYSYDALGRPVMCVDELGRVSRAKYDGRGRLVELLRPDGTTLTANYDSASNILEAADGLGQITRFEYSGTGHLARIVQADGQVFALRRDADERLVEILNPRMEVYRLEYDRADRVIAEITFDGRLLKYRYDRAGRVIRIDYPEGEWREFSYDKLGNVLEDRGEDVQIVFSRDALGRVEKATSSDIMGEVVTVFERDELGRLVAEGQNDRVVRYQYDESGRRVARTIDGLDRTEYAYDVEDAFAGVHHEGATISIRRDPAQRERARTGKHWCLTTEYDSLDRLASQQCVSDASAPDGRVALHRAFNYDSGGRVVTIRDTNTGDTLYRYDAVNQLVEARYGRAHEIFEYDPAGSLVRAADARDAGLAQLRWSLGAGNLLKATNHARYVNDGRGRRVQRVEHGSAERVVGSPGETMTTTYGWDSKDRLREVVLPDGARVRFAYDAFGRRVRKDFLPRPPSFDEREGAFVQSGVRRSIEFLWDEHVICEERIIVGEQARRRVHVHGPRGIPVLQIEGGAVYTVIVDHLGAPRELVDENGRIVWQGRSRPWGDLVSEGSTPRGSSDIESPFRLLGQYADEEIGLNYVRFRYWDPAHGRWLSPDPLNIKGGLNLLGFNVSPTLGVDPFGLTKAPFVPHPAHEGDTGEKGVHMNTEAGKHELMVTTDGKGNVTFTGWPKPSSGNDEKGQGKEASRRLATEANWRWQLLETTVAALREFLNPKNKDYQALKDKEALMNKLKAVQDALAKLIAQKDNGA